MILKDRMENASPIWRRIVKRAFGTESKGFLMQQGVAGGAAGNVAMTKVKVNDHLVGVIAIPTAAAASLDLTSQFSITADGVINNTGGTATTGYLVVATWEAFDDE
jgi:hypothetical protein